MPKVRVGQLYKDKLGNDVQVVNVDGTNRVTFRWGDGYERVCQSGVIDLNTLMREEDSRQLNPSFKCGDKGKLKDGTPWEIISYTTYSNIKIKVMTEPPWETTVSGGNLASGSIRNRGKPSLFGVGILGDAGERFDHGVLKEKLKLLAEECKNERGAGRKKKTDPSEVHRLKQAGATQEEVARKLDISISTVRRNWK